MFSVPAEHGEININGLRLDNDNYFTNGGSIKRKTLQGKLLHVLIGSLRIAVVFGFIFSHFIASLNH